LFDSIVYLFTFSVLFDTIFLTFLILPKTIPVQKFLPTSNCHHFLLNRWWTSRWVHWNSFM